MTNEVVRYEQSGLMHPADDGEWVDFEDYEKLRDALERITKVKFMGSCCGCSSDGGFNEVQQVAREALKLPAPEEPTPEPESPSVRTIHTSDLRGTLRDLLDPPGEDVEVVVTVDKP